MLIANWGDKSKKISDAGIDVCSNCHNLSAFELRTTESTAGLFFVSIAKWNKKYWYVCQTCSAGFPVSEGKEEEMIRLATEAPSHQVCTEIFTKMSKYFQEGNYFSNEEKLNGFLNDAIEKIKNDGYKEQDIRYIYPTFLKLLSSGLEAGKKN